MARSSPAYKRIHFLGDSFTVGENATAGNSYRDLLLDALQAYNADTGTEVYEVYAGSGARLTDQVSVLKNVIRPYQNPELIFIAIAQNDYTNLVTPEDYETALVTTLEYVRDETIAPCILVALPFQPHWWGNGASDDAKPFNVALETQAAAFDFVYAGTWEGALTEAGRSVAGDVPDNASEADNYHPNNTGHLQLYNALWADVGTRLSGAMHRKASGRAAAVGRTEASGRAAA